MRGLRTKHNLPEGVKVPRAPKKRNEDLILDDLCKHRHNCASAPKHSCQRRALIISAGHGTVAGEDGIVKATIDALKLKGFIHERTSKKGRTSWRATDTGRHVVADDRPVFLNKVSYLGVGADGGYKGSGYTRDPSRGLRGEDGRPCEVMREAA